MSRNDLDALYRSLLSRAGLALLAVLLVLNGLGLFAGHRAAKTLDETQAAAAQARLIMVSLERLRSQLLRLESAQRGFLLTRDRAYLQPFPKDIKAIDDGVANIRKLTRDRDGYDDLLKGIDTVARDKIADAEKTVALADFKSFDLAADLVRANAGKQLMAILDLNIARINELEEGVRAAKLAERQALEAKVRWGFVALFVVNALLILAGAYTILIEFRRRQREQADLAAQRGALERAVNERTAALRELSIHLQDLQETECHRLARELHDELGGTLSAIKLDLNMAANEAAVRADEKAHGKLTRALTALDEAIKVKRRIIEDLRPTLIDNLDYAAAFRGHCGQFTERTGCVCNLSLPEREIRLGEQHSIALYRVLQESLTNIAKYAQATQVDIVMRRRDSGVEMTITDNGVGMEPGTQHQPTSHGLIGMRERMRALEGGFEIDAAPGRGTRLIFWLPRDRTVTQMNG
ncbi:MAG: CHASE3 domain-containing protein [Betaproteobacteria bacterium]|nr:CHASE3 domain-containing protein [Betaproteobacteria bacterium]